MFESHWQFWYNMTKNIWPWPWTNDLDTQTWPSYSQDVSTFSAMALILKLDLVMVKMYPHAENEVLIFSYSRVFGLHRQTETQTDRPEWHYYLSTYADGNNRTVDTDYNCRFLIKSTTLDLSDLVDLLKPSVNDLDEYSTQPEEFIVSCSFDKKNCSYR